MDFFRNFKVHLSQHLGTFLPFHLLTFCMKNSKKSSFLQDTVKLKIQSFMYSALQNQPTFGFFSYKWPATKGCGQSYKATTPISFIQKYQKLENARFADIF